MLDTLIKSLQLKMTYSVNTFIYAIKQIPGLRKILSDRLYSLSWLKTLLTVLSVIKEILSTFIWKFVYVGIMIVLPLMLFLSGDDEVILPEWNAMLQAFIFLTIAGGIVNNDFLTGSMDKYYAVFLLRMDAKKHAISNYIYLLFRFFVGFLVVGLVVTLIMELPTWYALLIPCFVVAVKLFFAAIETKIFDKKNSTKEKKYFIRTKRGTSIGYYKSTIVFLLLVAAYLPVALGFVLPENILLVIMGTGIVIGIASVFVLKNYKNYRKAYRTAISEFMDSLSIFENAAVKMINNQIDEKNIVSSNKSGFEFLNELFVKRHRKILWRSSRNTAIGIAIVTLVALLAMIIIPVASEVVRVLITERLPMVAFAMYVLNKGQGYTRALFTNCDHSLLTYPVYRKGENILKLFRIRLREISKINLLPSAALAAGLSILLFFSGGPDNPIFYLVVIVSVIALGIFFSVHYLAMYYLLQPFTVNTEIKSGLYQIIMALTYIVCYMMMQLDIPPMWFGMVTIVFCVIYSIVASIMAYSLAPKTFRIK